MPLPDFLVIGAQKSASTFVQACLAEHPEVYVHPGEVPFFQSPDYERGSIEDLERLFEGRTERRLGMKRPSYLARPEVPDRIRRHLPDARLIAVLRDPVERAVSSYFHNVRYGFVPRLPLDEGFRRLLDGDLAERHPRAREILEYGFYHRHLARYADYLEAGRFLVLLHDDVGADPRAAIREAYAFLGVDPGHAPGALDARPQASVYDPLRLAVLRAVHRLSFRYDPEEARLHARDPGPLARAAIRGLRAVDRRLARHRPARRPRLGEPLEARLRALYRDDVERLETLLPRDLRAWKAGPARVPDEGGDE